VNCRMSRISCLRYGITKISAELLAKLIRMKSQLIIENINSR